MSIEQTGMVDFISTREWFVILTISDHLDWNDEAEHVFALQEKINAYLSFIESGELLEAYPQAVGKSPVIEVVMRIAPTPEGIRFFDVVRPIVEAAGFQLQTRILNE